MKALEPAVIQKFLQSLGDELSEPWTLTGGGVLQLLGLKSFSDADLEFVPPLGASMQDWHRVLTIAHRHELPVEALSINALFYLGELQNWKEDTFLLVKGKQTQINRLGVNSFIRLRLARLSEADLSDCLEYLAFALQHGEEVAEDELVGAVRGAMRAAGSSVGRKDRLAALLRVIEG